MMQKNNQIFTEISNVAPVLAGLLGKNPFKVPVEYFAIAQEALLVGVSDAESPEPIWPFLSKDLPFSTPEFYFQLLPDRMAKINRALDEDNIHLSIAPKQCFNVPAGYFQQIAQEVETRIHRSEDNLDAEYTSVGDHKGFSVPKGYFEELPDRLMAMMKEEEVLPAFEALKTEKSFTLPDNYFQNFPQRMMENIPAQGEQATPGIADTDLPAAAPAGRRFLKAMAAVAAMMVCLFMGYSIWNKADSTGSIAANFDLGKELSGASVGEMTTFVNEHIHDFDTELLATLVAEKKENKGIKLDEIDTRELEQYLMDNVDESLLKEIL